MNTLVIDTSFGSTVGITGHEPICEQDSRTHVEKLQHDIAQVCAEAKIQPHDIERIVVGIGPAPFTGLRAGIVAAKAIAYATGAQLLGQDSLSGQAAMMQAAYNGDPNLLNTAIFGNWNTPANAGTALHLTLSVNDARRKQLYYTLLANTNADTKDERIQLDMNIGTPSNIAAKVSAAVATIQQRHPDQPVAVEGDHGLASLDLGGNVLRRTLGDAGATLQCRFVDQPTDFVGELRMILLGKYHVNRIHSHVLLKW